MVKHIALGLAAFLVVAALIIFAGMPTIHSLAAPLAEPTSPASPAIQVTPEADPEIPVRTALDDSIKAHPDIISFQISDIIVDHILFSSDGQYALMFLAMKDKETGEVVMTEPGLAIARTQAAAASDTPGWNITLQADDNWGEVLQQVPEELLSAEDRYMYIPAPVMKGLQASALTGYKLPWTKGDAKYLTQSISHAWQTCPSCGYYAFDFADRTHFPILAAKDGYVERFRDTCANEDHSCTNYIIIEDPNTTPTTYQVYMHLENDSIPSNLKSDGARVLQGMHIANVDNTGQSTGPHLHFQVQTVLYSYTFYGPSVDIVFDDVAINGGRPRMCGEATYNPQFGSECNTKDLFTSGNQGPMDGNLTLPAEGDRISDRTFTVGGWATARQGLGYVQLMVNYDGTWRDAGPKLSGSPFAQQIDICSMGVPNGVFSLAMRVVDSEGNSTIGLPGLRQLVNNAPCSAPPAPACPLYPDEVVLYTDKNYQGGCQRFATGTTNLSGTSISVENVESLKVGANVTAVLSSNNRSESFSANEPNLSDNRIRNNTALQLIVQPRSTLPAAPVLNSPPANLSANDSLTLSWYGAAGATSFRSTLSCGGFSLEMPLANLLTFPVGSLPAGSCNWTVFAHNDAGETPASLTFNVASGTTLPAVVSVPYATEMENGAENWSATGLWRLPSSAVSVGGRMSKFWVFNNTSNNYNSATRSGDLTSPPMTIPADGKRYNLRFWYYSGVESAAGYWDQRTVQVSVDGGRFTDLYRFSFDRLDAWLQSPYIDLSAFAGKSVRLRFHFDSVDEYQNSGFGWAIDNVSVASSPAAPACSETASNDTVYQASNISTGSGASGSICPPGDLDYFAFDGQEGQRLSIHIEAASRGSDLNASMALLDSDGQSIIAENDDRGPGQADPALDYVTLPHSGRYYLRIKSFDHPGGGGPNAFYTLYLDNRDGLLLSFPTGWIPTTSAFTPSVSSSIYGSNLSRVDFYFHSSNWVSDGWQLINSDTDGSDGWTASYNPSGKGLTNGTALYAVAWDSLGNTWNALVSNMSVDNTAPSSQILSLQTYQSSALKINWGGSDNASGVDHYTIQYRDNGSAWRTWSSTLPATSTNGWFLGLLGHTYSFRMNAMDRAGNAQSFPESSNLADVTLPSSCSADIYDQIGDSAASLSIPLTLNEAQTHSLCNPSGYYGDSDWLSFTPEAGQTYIFSTSSRGGGAAAIIRLYSADGVSLQAQANPADYGQSTALVWTAPSSAPVLINVSGLDYHLAGSSVLYEIEASLSRKIYLPIIGR